MVTEPEMLPQEDYLRRLPAGLSLQPRIVIEGMVFASDAFLFAFRELEAQVAKLFSDSREINPEVRSAVFSSAWTCIDQVHALRQLTDLIADPVGREIAGPFQASTGAAHYLRNKMRHLKSNLANLAARSGRPEPIFGILHARGAANIEDGGSATIPMLTFYSGLLPAGHAGGGASIDTQNLDQPPAIEFEAFGKRVNLSHWALLVSELMISLSDQIATNIAAAVDVQATSPEERKAMLKPFGGEFFYVSWITLRPSAAEGN